MQKISMKIAFGCVTFTVFLYCMWIVLNRRNIVITHQTPKVRKYINACLKPDRIKKIKNTPGINVTNGSRGYISVVKSQFTLKQERDLLHLVLTARDSSGKQQTQGGNFFFATLSDSKKERWTAGKVIDYDNGTYSIYFYVGWGGGVYINVTLVNPREDVLWTEKMYRPLDGKSRLFGIFQKTDKTLNGTGICILRRNGTWGNKCEYRKENSLGQSLIICQKPQDFNCNDLILFTAGKKFLPKFEARQNSSKLFTADKKFLPKVRQNSSKLTNTPTIKHGIDIFEHFQIQKNITSIYMVPLVKQYFLQLNDDFGLNQTADSIENSKLKVGSVESLPKCRPGLTETMSDGYWYNNTWNSLVCNSKQWKNKTEILLCLKNKSMYFIGDSTLRQWYEELVKLVGYTENKKEAEDRLYRHSNNKLYNFNATFYFHFWYSTASMIYPVKKTKFMADFVDSLSDSTCNYIVFITASFHFPAWTRESYGEMLEKTKEAVDRLFERCPNSIVVVKGSHLRVDRKYNWILHDMNLHLGQIFAKDPRIIFIDVWDMVLSFPYSKDVHMPALVIIQELFLFFSSMCT